jgi:hypothetical protein
MFLKIIVLVIFRSDSHGKHDPIYDEEEEDEEILGSDDDEQEDPKDYCKGMCKSPLP